MSREEERNTTAHKIAWEYTKHYDPLLSKESWCELAARDAIDWADQHPRKGLWDAEKVCNILRNKMDSNWFYEKMERADYDSIIEDLRKAMED